MHPYPHFLLLHLQPHHPYTPCLHRTTTAPPGEGYHQDVCVIVLVVCDYFTRWSFMLLLQLICTFLYRTLYPFPFSPSSLWPFLYSHPSSLPLLTRLPQYQVTVHLSEIANPNIAEVTRLASLLPTSSTPSSPSPTSRDLHVTGPRYSPIDSVPSHVCTLVSPTAILSRDSTSRWYSRISDLVGSSSDLRISSVTLGPSFFGFGHCSDPFGSTSDHS